MNRPMTDAELRLTRDRLGVTGEWLTAHLRIDPRSARRYERGTRPIPEDVRTRVLAFATETDAFVDSLVRELSAQEHPVAIVHRTDADYRAADPNGDKPASWHRHAVARAAERVPDLEIRYSTTSGPEVDRRRGAPDTRNPAST
ncbi:transcriptional regulator [Embleya sp. NPDC005971]|uniref:transcriptional regulator n=1 Tax=Embleya sp. NPDC005971 TaxID=3156724 RepID=UPI0033DE089D